MDQLQKKTLTTDEKINKLVEKNLSKSIEEGLDTYTELALDAYHDSFDERLKTVFSTPEKTVEAKTNAEFLLSSHKEEYVSQLKKKHLVKADEYEMVPVTTGKQEITEKKKQNWAKIEKDVNEISSHMIKMQDDIDINVAKYTDFSTVKALSAFSNSFSDIKQFEAMVKSYAGDDKVDDGELISGRYAILGELTEKIMKMDPSDFDVSTSQRIVDQSKKFELMSVQLEAYQNLLKKNEGYKKVLADQKDKDGESYLDRVEERVHNLGKLSRYYRIQKLIMEDSLYQNSRNNEIPMEASDKDDFQTKRLKKLLRISYYMGRQLSGAELSDLSAESQSSKKIDTYARNTFAKKESIDKKNRAGDDAAMDQELNVLEFERFFVPQDSLKIKLNPPIPNPDPRFAFLGTKQADTYICEELSKDLGKHQLYDKIHDYKTDYIRHKEGEAGELIEFGAAVFSDAKSFDPKTVFSEILDRQLFAFVNVYSYKQTDDEIMHMIKNITIPKSKEYEKMKHDPKALAYYESCYIDSMVKYQALRFGAAKRIANGMGDKPFFMHTKDLIMNDNAEIRATIMAVISGTNMLTIGNNDKAKDFYKKFLKDGKYPVDFNEMSVLCNAYSNYPFKVNSWIDVFVMDLNEDEPQIFPEESIAKVREWRDKNLPKRKGKTIGHDDVAAYLDKFHHDEIVSGKIFEKRDKNGKLFFDNHFARGQYSILATNLLPVQQLLFSNLIEHTSEKELQKYEKKLKDNNYTSVFSKNDKYMMDEFRNNYTEISFNTDGSYNEQGLATYQYRMTKEEREKYED